MQKFPANFTIAAMLTFLSGTIIILISLGMGKTAMFLALNNNLGNLADFFFRYWTNLGDGITWLLVALIFFVYGKRQFPLLLLVILVSTLLTQTAKILIFTESLRPTALILEKNLMHTVKGVTLHSNHSFPSGHTTTAFCVYLLACLFIRQKWVVPIGFIMALLVGYSRVYLAQHFPLDVGAGMITAVATLLICTPLQDKWKKRSLQP